jgi:uncharacterized peroxidase-related enzyme
MRLGILDSGYGPGTRLLFAFVHAVSRRPMPDAARLGFYRPDFSGKRMRELTHEAMRGPSAWSVGDRELMAAVVSAANQCAFCRAAHSATAARARGSQAVVAAVLDDLDGAPIEDPLRATLRLLRKLTVEHAVSPSDMGAVLAAGASRQQVEDALAVCFAFNTTNRLADAFGFSMLDAEGFDAGARYLLDRGYR